jgi:hypothetical protein
LNGFYEEFKNLRESFIPDGKCKYDDTRDKVEVEVEEESVKKIAPCAQQKKLFEQKEKQIAVAASQQTKQPLLAPALVTSTQFPMLPLLHPLLYLPLIEQQTRAKQELPVTLKDITIQAITIFYMNLLD